MTETMKAGGETPTDRERSERSEGKEGGDSGRLMGLPRELQMELCGWLGAKQLCALGASCRSMNVLANDPHLWHNLCLVRFKKLCKKRRFRPALASHTAVKQTASDSRCNEWKRAYCRWHKMEHGWRNTPNAQIIEFPTKVYHGWVASRKIWACGDEHLYSICVDEVTDKQPVPPVTEYQIPKGVKVAGPLRAVNQDQPPQHGGIVCGVGSGEVVIWDLDLPENKTTVRLDFEHVDFCSLKAGKLVYSDSNVVAVVDVEMNKHSILGNNEKKTDEHILSWAVEGDLVAIGDSAHTVRLWDMRTPQSPIKKITSFHSDIWTMHLYNNHLACGTFCDAYLFDGRMHKPIWHKDAHADLVRYIQFDDLKIVTGGLDGHVKAWDMQTFEQWWSAPIKPNLCGGSFEDEILVVWNNHNWDIRNTHTFFTHLSFNK